MARFKKTGLYDGASSEWDESKHPRDKKGQFTTKAGDVKNFNFNIQLFAADYSKQTNKQLNKSRRSHEKNIQKHNYKLEHPEEFYKNWENMSYTEKLGRLQQWEKEIKNYNNQIILIDKEFEKRKNKNGN